MIRVTALLALLGIMPAALAGAPQVAVDWLVEREPITSVGVLDGSPAEMFALVYDATLFADGSIAVLDGRALEVRVFSPSGDVISVFGREGDGPGEFRSPFGIEAFGDTILVWDFHKAVLMRWTRGGVFLSQVPAEHPRTIHEGELLSDGSLAIPLYEVFDPPAEGKYRAQADLIRYQRSATQNLGSFPYTEMRQGDRSSYAVPFASDRVMAAGGDPLRIAIVEDTNVPRVRVFDEAGQLLDTLQVIDLRRRVDAEIWEEALAPMRRRFGRNNPAFEHDLLAWGRPEFTPAMSDVAVDDRGRVWILQSTPDGLSAYIHADREVIGRLLLPGIERVFEIKGDRIVALRRGEYDVESVEVYRYSER